MKRVHMLVDGNFLCHRALHTPTFRNMENDQGDNVGVIVGFVRTLRSLYQQFTPDYLVVTFDDCAADKLWRTELFPAYKKKRREKVRSESEQADRVSMLDQQLSIIEWLSCEMGIKVAHDDQFGGWEADDWIAAYAQHPSLNVRDDRVIMVSADKDLYQLLSNNVCMFNPSPYSRKIIDYFSFQQEYKIRPAMWKQIKAIAGCTTDGIPGCSRVREATAIKWKKGQANAPTKNRIEAFIKTPDYKRNLELVGLPFKRPAQVFQSNEYERYPDVQDKCPNLLDSRLLLDSLFRYGIREI